MEIAGRNRSHFLGLLYEYLILARTSVAPDALPGLAYALHNLPSMLDDENWTEMHSEATWKEIRGAANLMGVGNWLEETDQKLRDQALLGTSPVPRWHWA